MANVSRTKTSHSPTVSIPSSSFSVQWLPTSPDQSVREIQTHQSPSQLISRGGTPMIPPYHWHWSQEEYFRIQSGRFIFTLEGKDVVKTREDGLVTIPVKARHTFRADPSCTEDCVVEISAARRDDGGINERFFRNLYSYLDDCAKEKKEPSPVQMLLFLDSAEVSLGLPGPAWLMRWVSWGIGVVVGRWFGAYVLGYRSSYEEYCDSKDVKRS